MTYLLDVNVLIAAIWVPHNEHARADAWVQKNQLATCVIAGLATVLAADRAGCE